MVRLDKLYTRNGDDGNSRLIDGQLVQKTHPRLELCGALDEANAQLGVVRASGVVPKIDEAISMVQNDLFDAGADWALPVDSDGPGVPRITEAHVKRLEEEIDAMVNELEPLNSFVLPGGTAPAAHMHLARTMVRRAEREAVAVRQEEGAEMINRQAMIYLNRLSDWCFAVSRMLNDRGRGDILWKPGQNA